MGIECRTDDAEVHALLEPLHHFDTERRVAAERALNRRLNGGCQVPIACYAVQQGELLWLRGLVGQPDGGLLLRAEARGPLNDPATLGVAVAEDLLAQGAQDILGCRLRDQRRIMSGWRLLLTRPAEENPPLAAALAQAGIATASLPLLDLQPLAETPAQRSLWLDLDRYAAVLVVSKPAARLGLAALDQYWPQPPLQAWFAVGAATRRRARRLWAAGAPPPA